MQYWQIRNPAYVSYYKRQWTQIVPIDAWALCMRPKEARTGDQVVEGWHNRLKTLSFPKSKPFDFAVGIIFTFHFFYLFFLCVLLTFIFSGFI